MMGSAAEAQKDSESEARRSGSQSDQYSPVCPGVNNVKEG